MLHLVKKGFAILVISIMISAPAQPQKLDTTLRNACDGGEGSPRKPNPMFYTSSCIGLQCLKAGQYEDAKVKGVCHPLLITSYDGGQTWTNRIHSDKKSLPSDFDNYYGVIENTYCNGANCFAFGGYYGRSDYTASYFPLLVQSSDWFQTLDYKYLVTKAQHPFLYHNRGLFTSMTCSGSICVAVGSYDAYIEPINKVLIYPLIANSTDKGATWTISIDGTASSLPEKGSNDYPKLTLLPADLVSHGIFNSVSCTGLNCVAVGEYSTSYYVGGPIYPLLANSKDGGATWTYSIHSNKASLPLDFHGKGAFNSVQCKDYSCVAAGYYQNNANTKLPLLASSNDGGDTWIYNSP